MPKYFSIFLVAITLSAFSQESSLEFNTDIGLFNSSINSQLLSQSYGFLDEIEKSNIIDALKAEIILPLKVITLFFIKIKKAGD